MSGEDRTSNPRYMNKHEQRLFDQEKSRQSQDSDYHLINSSEDLARLNDLHAHTEGQGMVLGTLDILGVKNGRKDYQVRSMRTDGKPIAYRRDDRNVFTRTLDTFTDGVRAATPALIVNNGAQISFGIRGVADYMGYRSGTDFASPWRARAAMVSMAALAAGVVLKEQPITEEERQRFGQMDLPDFIAMRIKHAFQPHKHITATIGMTTLINGIMGVMSGRAAHRPYEEMKGWMTIAGGAALNFIPDQERAMQVATGIFTVRAPVSFTNAMKAYKHGTVVDQPDGTQKKVGAGDTAQLTKFGLNQTSSIFAFFYGGVRKLPDGTIVSLNDEKELHEKRAAEAREEAWLKKLEAEKPKAESKPAEKPKPNVHSSEGHFGARRLPEPANDHDAITLIHIDAPASRILTKQLTSERVDTPEKSAARDKD